MEIEKCHGNLPPVMWQQFGNQFVVRPALTIAGLCAVTSFTSRRTYRPLPRPATNVLSKTSVQCAPKQSSFQCIACSKTLPRGAFAKRQQGRETRICSMCASARVTTDNASKFITLTCVICGEELDRESFAKRQQYRKNSVCIVCASQKKRKAFLIQTHCIALNATSIAPWKSFRRSATSNHAKI